MNLNRTGIEWVRNPDGTPGFTWNPIVGCSHGCPYCWARKQAKRSKNRCDECYQFIPHVHHERLDDPLKRKKPSTIFVCSMGDLFCPDLSDCEIERVFKITEEASHHTFLMLTKTPRNATQWVYPGNVWFGVSCDGLENEGQANRVYWMTSRVAASKKFISFEPHLWPVYEETFALLKEVNWIIIGGQTGEKFYPPKEWVMPIVEQAKRLNIPVFMKPNLGPEYAGQLIQEFPKELRKVEGEQS